MPDEYAYRILNRLIDDAQAVDRLMIRATPWILKTTLALLAVLAMVAILATI